MKSCCIFYCRDAFMLWKQFQGHIHFRCIGLSKEYGALPLVEYVVVFLNIGKLYMNFKHEIELMPSQSILTYKWKYTLSFFSLGISMFLITHKVESKKIIQRVYVTCLV